MPREVASLAVTRSVAVRVLRYTTQPLLVLIISFVWRPLSPLIFMSVANGLHRMIVKSQEEGLIKDLGFRGDTNAVINLHNANDTHFWDRVSDSSNGS